ncbi:MAG: anhydro-N-acetylmuramic acid kinase [Phycisphaerae bacterium]|jgi:anhydro-N-acetylmuramic acid kinase
MSGTSADGIDAVAVRVTGHGDRMGAGFVMRHHLSYPPRFRQRLLAAMAPAQTTTEEIARLHAELGELFGQAAVRAMRALGPRRRPVLIGLAGQTVCHLPGPRGRTVTLQLGEAARVAERTGVAVVCEFRQSDVAAGGQGAPLVPWTDWVLFRDRRVHRAVQNIGGIANVTYIPAGARATDVIAFDTGPGNMIIDGLVSHITGGRETCDHDGRRAKRGRVLHEVLKRWLAHPYFKRRIPKTTGRETFGRAFIEREWPLLREVSSNPDDWVATATAFTASSIADSYRRHISYFNARGPGIGHVQPMVRQGGRDKRRTTPPSLEVILGGGGARNPVLVAMLKDSLGDVTFCTTENYGIPPEAKEGLSFALLATACVAGYPSNLPHVTGASRPVILGRLVLPSTIPHPESKPAR